MAALSRSTARPSVRRTSTAAAAASRPPPPAAATASAAIPSAAVPDPAATPLRMAATAIAATADDVTTTTSTIITAATTMRTPTRRTMASPPPAPTSWTRSSAVMTLWALLLSACCLTQCWSGAEAAISNRASKPQVAAIQPRFLSRGHTYRAVVGDTLVLPCEVENLGALVLLWRRGPNVLTASQLMVTQDERIRLMDGYNLEISELEPQDAGDYVCQISDKVNKDQVHTVEILVPPSIRAVPQTGQLTARKGGTITLECKASGNPVPSIFWTKKSDTTASNGDGGSIGSTGSTSGSSGSRSRNVRSYHRAQPKDTTPSQQQQQQQLLQAQPAMRIGDGPILTLERVERQQAGIYQCTADNNVGEPVTVDMRLDVLYPPDISVEKSWIHSGEGFEAQLVCIVHADPAPTVSWLQNSFPLQQTDRRTMASRGNRHSLNIRHVQPEDFGNYSCVADNSLGRSKKYMEVSGRPGPAEFHSSPWSRSQDSYNLTWKVDSYPPLQEVRLLYRKLMVNETFQQPGRWHDVILTPTPRASSEPLSHIMSFTLKGLQPTSVYEAIVQAKNRYGWNEVSDIFQFHTQRSSLEPRTVELEMVASSTSRSGTSPIRAAVCGSTLTVAAILVAVWSVRRGV